MSEFENLKLDNQLCFALYSATNSITRLYRSLLSEFNLTYPQYLVLLVLWEKDGVAIKEVMQRLKLDSGTLSPLIKRLQTAGLLHKERTQYDERVIKLFLTDKAKQLEPFVAQVQDKVACHTGLASSEFFELLTSLNQLAESLNNKDKAKVVAS